MRAIRVAQHGGLDALELVELPDPAPGPGQIVVRMEAIALNHLDVWVRRGVPGHEFPLPLVPASDGVGVATAVGSGVSHVHEGDDVFVLPGVSCGRCVHCLVGDDELCVEYDILGESRDGLAAEFVCLPATNVQPRPRGVSLETAASFSLTFLTAWNMLVRRARVRPGEFVLIQAGGSGVGVAAIAIAKLLGARVAATAGGEAKCERLTELGVELAIDSRQADAVKAVRSWTDHHGADVVVDHVGKDTFATSLRCLARAGRYVTCGATTGPQVELLLSHVFFKSLSILGSTMGRKGDLLRIAQLVERGALKPVVGRVLDGLESIREGHRLLEERSVFGKVVIRLEE